MSPALMSAQTNLSRHYRADLKSREHKTSPMHLALMRRWLVLVLISAPAFSQTLQPGTIPASASHPANLQLPPGQAQPGQASVPEKATQEPGQLTLRTTVPLVVVPVSVMDGKGNPVDGLAEEDFVVLDDDKPRKVRVETSDAIIAPLSVVIAIQTNSVSQPALLKIRQVGSIIAESVAGANGEVAVVGYSDEVKVLHKFTRDPNQVTDTFEDLKPGGSVGVTAEKARLKLSGSRMVDALSKAADLLERGSNVQRSLFRRSVIVVIGESKDRGSQVPLADVINRLQKVGATIYGLSYSEFLTPFTTKATDYETPSPGVDPRVLVLELAQLAQKNTMDALVAATGGEHLSFETKRKLENDLFAMSKQIHSRYYVSFTPANSDQPQFHRLQISIRDHPGAAVRARPGYWTGLESPQ